MYTLNETSKHLKLLKILRLIEKFENYVSADYEALHGFAANHVPGFRQQLLERITMREKIIIRLNFYYAKQVFQLASDTYNRVKAKPEESLKKVFKSYEEHF